MGSKLIQLLSLLPRKPVEFYERLADFADGRFDAARSNRQPYPSVLFEEGLSSLLSGAEFEPTNLLDEKNLGEIEGRLRERMAELPEDAPFSKVHNGDALLARLCYVVARCFRPQVVAETGVCYGVTSAYLLAALEANGAGHLYSIDLPPLAANGDRFVGWFVPGELRRRWTLAHGSSGRLLNPLLQRLGSIDLFVHDSLHTYNNMKFEFAAAWGALRPGGVLISDDIEGNRAFAELTCSAGVLRSMVFREKNKDALVGVAVKRA